MTDRDDQLLDYLYGEMSAEERETFKAAHQDPQMQKELQELLRTRSILRALPQETPSASISHNILRQARLHADQRQHRQNPWARLWKPLTMIGATSAAALALIISMRTYQIHDTPSIAESRPSPALTTPPSIPDREPQPSAPATEQAEPLEVAPGTSKTRSRSARRQAQRSATPSPARRSGQRPSATPFAEQETLAPADSIQPGSAAERSSERTDTAAAPKASRSIQSHPPDALESGLLLLRDGQCLAAFPLLERALAANAQSSERIVPELSLCRRALVEKRARYPRLSRLLPATSLPAD